VLKSTRSPMEPSGRRPSAEPGSSTKRSFETRTTSSTSGCAAKVAASCSIQAFASSTARGVVPAGVPAVLRVGPLKCAGDAEARPRGQRSQPRAVAVRGIARRPRRRLRLGSPRPLPTRCRDRRLARSRVWVGVLGVRKKREQWRLLPRVIASFAGFHLGYGVGMLAGWLTTLGSTPRAVRDP
jgi:hypothetical protein